METHLAHSSRLTLALLLGMLAGFVSGWNLTLAVLLLFVLALDVPLRRFLPIWAVSAGLAWLCVPVSYQVGRLVLDHTPVGASVAALGEGTFVSLFDWDRYVLAGGMVTAIVIGAPLVWAANWALDAWLAGPLLDDQQGLRPRFRPLAWKPRWRRHAARYVLAGIACIGITWLFVPRFASKQLMHELTIANGADVHAAAAKYSLVTGLLSIDNLELVDPDNLKQNRLTAARVTARLAPGPWLRGRYLLDDLRLQGIATRTPLTSAARAVVIGAGAATVAEQQGEALPAPPTGLTELPLESSLHSWERLQPQLASCQALFEQLAALACSQRGSEPAAKPGWVFADRGNLASLRSSLGLEQPRVVIRSLQADDLAASCGLGAKAMVELKGFSSLSGPDDEPARLTIVAPDRGFDLTARLNFGSAKGKHDVRFRVFDLSLAGLPPHFGAGGCLFVDRGRLSLTGQGWASSSGFDVAIGFRAEDFGVYVSGPQTVAGMTPQLWTAGLSCLDEFRGEAALRGSWNAPRLVIDHQKLIGCFELQLRAAGGHEYVRAIAEQTSPGYQPPQLAAANNGQPYDGITARATDRLEGKSSVSVPLETSRLGATEQPSTAPVGRVATAAVPASVAPSATMSSSNGASVATTTPVAYPNTGYPSTDEAYCRVPPTAAVEPPGPIDLAIGYDAEFVQAQASRSEIAASTEAAATTALSPPIPTAAEAAFDPVPQFRRWPEQPVGGSAWPPAESALAFDPPPAAETPAVETEPSLLSRWYQVTVGRFQRSAEPTEAQAVEAATANFRQSPTTTSEAPRQASRPWYYFGRN